MLKIENRSNTTAFPYCPATDFSTWGFAEKMGFYWSVVRIDASQRQSLDNHLSLKISFMKYPKDHRARLNKLGIPWAS